MIAPAANAGPLAERADSYQWRLCPAGRLIPIKPGYTSEETDRGSIEIRADSSRIVKDGVSRFDGDVEVVKGNNSLAAQVITYDHNRGIFDAEGRTHLWNGAMIWSGESAHYDLNTEISQLSEGQYWLQAGRGRGHAASLEHNRPEQMTVLENVDYSTCPLSDEAWRVTASKIKLNHESDRGSATHAVLRVRNIPVFYFPYVNFPLSDKRKSGLLAPTAGSTNQSGADIQIPYYWNIAPNYDATLTPRILTDRGEMLGGEFRYLGQTFRGEIAAEYLPSDDLLDGKDRSLVSFDHSQLFFDGRGRFDAIWNNVSDNEYFEDFGGSIRVTSQRFIDRRVSFRYRSRDTRITALAQAYQIVDDSIRRGTGPYRRLPQIRLSHRFTRFGRFVPSIRAEATYFDRDESVTAGRLHVAPALNYEYIKPYLRIVPRLVFAHTQYFIDDPRSNFDDNESRTVPIFSLNSQLFFERNFELFGRHHLQTFEPRIFYLLIPNVDQSQLPRFDSGIRFTSFRNIFNPNRFTGLDRIGDANQITTAITSRILDTERGNELMSLSIGQIYYFRDREVTLPRREEETDRVSELIAEASANLNSDWSVRGTVQWDPNKSQTEISSIALRYRPNLDTVLNFRYRFRRAVSDIEQTDLSLRFPLTRNTAIIGRWNYSLPRRQTLEAIGGIEYESCCWGARLVARRFLRNTEGEFDNGMFMQVHFRGLGGFGKKSGSLLRRGIPGYVDPFD